MFFKKAADGFKAHVGATPFGTTIDWQKGTAEIYDDARI
jgi:hypothetical protein